MQDVGAAPAELGQPRAAQAGGRPQRPGAVDDEEVVVIVDEIAAARSSTYAAETAHQ